MESVKRIKFSFNKPVGLRYLYDRDEELGKLLESKSSFLIGPLGIGKTSLLKSYVIKSGCEAIWIDGTKVLSLENFINAMKKEYKDFFKKVMDSKKTTLFSELKAPMLEIENYQNGKSDSLTFVNNFLGELSYIQGVKICLIIDDFTEMRKIGTAFTEIKRALYKTARKRNLNILLSSSELGYAKEILQRKDLPLQKAFFSLTVKPFNQEDSAFFISKGLEQYGVSCPKKNIGEAYYVAEGFPLWLSLIGLRMLEGKCNPQGIYTDSRTQVFWVERLSRLTSKERQILRLIAKNKSFKAAGPHSRRTLEYLIRKGYVLSNKHEHIVDPILNYLLKFEYI